MNIAKASELYLLYVKHTKNLSDHTVKAYQQDIKLLLSFIKTESPVALITRLEIREVINALFSKGDSRTTIKRRLAFYKSMFSWLENEEIIEQTPFHKLDVKIKLPQRLPRNLSSIELKKIRDASLVEIDVKDAGKIDFQKLTKRSINHATTFIGIELLLATGLRISELTSIKIDDVFLSERYINIRGKGERERRVFITTEQIQRYLKNCPNNNLVFSQPRKLQRKINLPYG